ncbi:MAG: 3-hydroxybutyryl-CoA dehydrogenase [Saprospiraceae bacterium]|nr:3-hydroxybutyryl-CoA dehydrogenase [Candidatus Opimibacter iunctus]
MKRVAVIGAGAMGSGIAQVAAMAGHEVILYDAFPNAVAKGRDGISQSLNKLAEKGKITDQEAKTIFGRLYFAESLDSIAGSDLIIEAIIEREEEKKKLFALIEPLVSEQAIIASNTSSLPITSLANGLKHPERFIGIHFFNPPVMMQLVEIIPALQTASYIIENIMQEIRSWGKTPVRAKDTPGFIVNRIARPYYGEALRIAEEQLATPAMIDKAMKHLGGFRMGPFELMDFIGNDINEAVTRSVWTSMHFDSRYRPSQLQVNLVRAGWYGRKSGRGYYDYAAKVEEPSDALTEEHAYIFRRVLVMLINEAADALYYGIASKEDIDLAMTLGVNYPKGLLKWADEKGIAECVRQIDDLYYLYKEERYRCSVLLRKMAEARQTFYG